MSRTATQRKRDQTARERASGLTSMTIARVPVRVHAKLKADALANGYTLNEWCVKKLSA